MDRGMTADQALAALWRRKVLVGAIVLAGLAIGAAMMVALPSVYSATAVVRVEPQRPGEEMVQRTVSELIEQRLLTVRQELMGRPVLQRAIEELGLYPELLAKRGMDAAVEAMRRDLEVRVEGESAFELTYTTTEPELAARVANRLPELYAQQTLAVRRGQAERATQLFAQELASQRAALADWERSLAQFKVDHIGELPEQLEMNMRGLDRVMMALQTQSDALRLAETRRSELAQARAAGDSEAGRLAAAESTLTREWVAARAIWTPDHPEVQRMARELEALTARREEAEGRMWIERQERQRAAAVVTRLEGDIQRLRQQAEAYQQRIERTPKWTHELAVLDRDYDIARTKYQSLVSRKVEAELAQGLEARGAESMFNVVSPAGVPVAPSKPDRFGGMVVALLLSLGAAILAALLLELRDDSVRTPGELRNQVPLPVLAVVPNMQGKSEKRVLMPTHGRAGSQTLN